MKLEGSCDCGAVRFKLQADSPCPFMRCYCSICRKTAGAGGYAINLGGERASFKLKGRKHVSVYRAQLIDGQTGKRKRSSARRHFCKHCGSPLWVWDPTWPELIHPHASAIDTELPPPPEVTHIMLGSRATWVKPQFGRKDQKFDEYPQESLADWHRRMGLG